MANQQESSDSLGLIEIPGLDGYFTDGNGRIYSTKRGAVPKLMTDYDHYGNHSSQPHKRLKIGGKLQLAHRVIARVICGRELLASELVNHVDGCTANNSLSNLEIVTHKENVQHAVSNGLYCSGAAWYAARGVGFPEGRESSETRSYRPERTMKAHECAAAG